MEVAESNREDLQSGGGLVYVEFEKTLEGVSTDGKGNVSDGTGRYELHGGCLERKDGSYGKGCSPEVSVV